MSTGAQFAQARAERRLSIAQVSQATKIPPWILEALEADQPPETVHPTYLKAFTASYARFLGIAALEFVPVAPDSPPAAPALPPPVPLVDPVRWSIPWHWAAYLKGPIGVVAVVAVIVLVNPFRWLPKGSLASSKTRTLASVTPVRSAAPAALPKLVLAPTQPLELRVTANATTWVRVRADGKLLTQQRIVRGTRERWSAKKRLELIVAKPSQTDLVLNGQSLNPFAIAYRGRLAITHYGVTELQDDDF